MALRTEESAVDLSDPLAAWSLFHGINLQNDSGVWGQKIPGREDVRSAWNTGCTVDIGDLRWIQTTPLTASQKMGCQLQVLGSYDPSNQT